jgi:hypothetical protein
MATKLCTTVTLIRGQLYTYRHPDGTPQNPKDSIRFEYGVALPIDDPKLIKTLENMTEEVRDGDGEYYDKPIFRVDRNVRDPRAEEDDAAPKRATASAHRAIRTVPKRRLASQR